MADALWLTEADVAATIDLSDAATAVRHALLLEHAGTARTLAKTAVSWSGGHTLHALGGVAEGLGLVGAKTWAHTAGGADPVVVLWSEQSGQLVAVIEAFALGQLRTASVSAVAIAQLSDAHSSVMAIIGTGKQAMAQVAAAFCERPITMVRVYSPTPANRNAFAERVAAMADGCDVVVCDSVEQAVEGADIVTTATRSRDAFLHAAMLQSDVLVNALGAITPERAEVDDDLVADATVVSDSPDVALELSSELRVASSVTALSAVVAAGSAPPPGCRLFKAMGLGLADVAVAAEVLRRCQVQSRGVPIPPRVRAVPQLFPAKGQS